MQIQRCHLNTTLPWQIIMVNKGYKFLSFGVEENMSYMYYLADVKEEFVRVDLYFIHTGDNMSVKDVSDCEFKGSFVSANGELIHVFMKEIL